MIFATQTVNGLGMGEGRFGFVSITVFSRFPSFQLCRGFVRAVRVVILSGLLAAGSTSARAGDAEVGALNAELIQMGVLLSTANSAQLAQAVFNVLTSTNPAYVKFKPGGVAGEALKAAGSSAPDAGQAIATQALTVSKVAADKLTFVGLAASTAGTGRAPNVTQVATFSAVIVETDQDAITAAIVAKKSKSGLAAVLAGRSSELPDDASRVTLTNLALANRILVSAAQSIATGVADFATDSANYALATSLVNSKYASKIVVGTTAAEPTNAGAIFNAVLSSTSTDLAGLKKSVASLAKSVAAVADIEEIEKVGNAIGNQIKAGTIKLSLATSITKALAQAIIKKPVITGLFTDRNRPDNKRDEIAEAPHSCLVA